MKRTLESFERFGDELAREQRAISEVLDSVRAVHRLKCGGRCGAFMQCVFFFQSQELQQKKLQQWLSKVHSFAASQSPPAPAPHMPARSNKMAESDGYLLLRNHTSAAPRPVANATGDQSNERHARMQELLDS